jgi:hypothetical protein
LLIEAGLALFYPIPFSLEKNMLGNELLNR